MMIKIITMTDYPKFGRMSVRLNNDFRKVYRVLKERERER